MYRLLTLIFVATLLFSTSFALEIKGSGIGKSEKDAKDEALADISSSIHSDVSSSFKKYVKVQDEAANVLKEKVLNVKTDLPIMGANFNVMTLGDEFQADAVMNSDNVKTLYSSKLQDIVKEVGSLTKIYETASENSKKREALLSILNQMESYYKFKTVAIAIGISNVDDLGYTESDIKSKLAGLEKNIDSIEYAADVIASGIKLKDIYVYPPTAKGTKNATKFGSVIADYISSKVSTVAVPAAAKHVMYGSYDIFNDYLILTMHVVDKQMKVVKSSVVKISSKAYKGMKLAPDSLALEQALADGTIVSSDLRADIRTRRGKNSLLYKKGETVYLQVKLNKPGYYYMMGHVKKERGEYSYLVEIGEGQGNRKFVNFVSAEDANKWIELGEFEVGAPYGNEVVQIFASNIDIIDKIPSSVFNAKTELYEIDKNPVKAVMKTRALVKKKKQKKEENSEAYLEMTTIDGK